MSTSLAARLRDALCGQTVLTVETDDEMSQETAHCTIRLQNGDALRIGSKPDVARDSVLTFERTMIKTVTL